MKEEPGLDTIYELSNDDLPNDVEPKLPLQSTSTPIPQSLASSSPSLRKPVMQSQGAGGSVLECLKKLASKKGSRNIFKQIDYSTVPIKTFQFLPLSIREMLFLNSL